MIQTLAAAAAAIMLLSAASAAQAASDAAPAAKAAETSAPGKGKPNKDKVVCRVETPAGSRLGKRVCMTLAERERQEEEATKGFGEMQRVVNTTFSKGN